MRLKDLFTRKKDNKNIESEQEIESIEIPKYYEISLLRMLDADWRFFGARLMLKGVIPSVFDQHPKSVKLGIAWNNTPYVELTYKSRKDDDSKTFRLYQEDAKCVIDGTWETNNEELLNLWKNFKNYLQGLEFISRNQNIQYHTRMVDDMFKEYPDQKPDAIDFDEFYKKEDEFINEHKYTIFESFGCIEDEYAFAEHKIDLGSETHFMNCVKPFSPRTLEYCVLRLSSEEKDKIRQDIDLFQSKCMGVALSSSFVTEDWERTINLLVDVVGKEKELGIKDEPLAENGVENPKANYLS